MTDFDAVLVVSFGGPEGPDDVVPFLRNVTRGRDIPDERLAVVGAHYAHFDGISPINEQCRRLVAALDEELRRSGDPLPVYWGNRNWHPYLAATVQQMADDGVTRALAIVTSAYSSHSGCRQYLDDIEKARAQVGASAPVIEKVRHYFDHPGFVEPFRDGVRTAIDRLGRATPLVFTAHSIPTAMAATSDYEAQLRATAELVASAAPESSWTLAWQSRSGPPTVPWLEPDINDHLRDLAAHGTDAAVIVPIGFVSDHMEVVWDLDTEARATADELGIRIERAATPGTGPDPRFVAMWAELVAERLHASPRRALSALPERPNPCAEGCCPSGRPSGR
ncbi:MAG: ferrochelatase [Acidimicrobiales bacterium]